MSTSAGGGVDRRGGGHEFAQPLDDGRGLGTEHEVGHIAAECRGERGEIGVGERESEELPEAASAAPPSEEPPPRPPPVGIRLHGDGSGKRAAKTDPRGPRWARSTRSCWRGQSMGEGRGPTGGPADLVRAGSSGGQRREGEFIGENEGGEPEAMG